MTAFRDGAAVAWYDVRDGNAEIYLRLIDSAGRVSAMEHRLTADAEQSYEVSLAATDDALAVAWYGRHDDDRLSAYVGVWEADAGWRWRRHLSGERRSRNPVVRAHGDRLFVAWIEAGQGADSDEVLRYGYWLADGTTVSPPRTIGAVGAQTWNLNAAFRPDGESAIVAFDAPDRTGVYELFLASAEPDRADLTQLSGSDGFASRYPDIAVSSDAAGDSAALTWYDEKDGNQEVYLAALDLAAMRAGDIDLHAQRISFSDGPSIGSYLAWKGETIGVAWSDRSVQSFDIRFQAFDRSGEPLGAVVPVTNTPTDSLIPAIVSWADGFSVAWNEMQAAAGGVHDSTGSEVFVLRLHVDAQH